MVCVSVVRGCFSGKEPVGRVIYSFIHSFSGELDASPAYDFTYFGAVIMQQQRTMRSLLNVEL